MSAVSLAIGLGVVAMVLALFVLIDRRGRSHERAKQLQGAVDEIEVAQEVRRETDAMSNTDIARELHDKWTRK